MFVLVTASQIASASADALKALDSIVGRQGFRRRMSELGLGCVKTLLRFSQPQD
jgi:hypothetical protein